MGVGISDHDREKMEDIVAGYGDWFTAKLIRLIAKADVENTEKLRSVYPDEVAAYEDWYYEGEIPTHIFLARMASEK